MPSRHIWAGRPRKKPKRYVEWSALRLLDDSFVVTGRTTHGGRDGFTDRRRLSVGRPCERQRAGRRWVRAQPQGTPSLTGKHSLAYRSHGVGDIFKAIADPTRRAILDELVDRDGQTLFELCARLTMRHGLTSSRQAISQHLDVLESAGLVATRREGRFKFHHVDTTPLQTIIERWPIEE